LFKKNTAVVAPLRPSYQKLYAFKGKIVWFYHHCTYPTQFLTLSRFNNQPIKEEEAHVNTLSEFKKIVTALEKIEENQQNNDRRG
jgi:hypothetical protein